MSPASRRWLGIAITVLVVILVAALAWRGWQSRQAAQQAQSAAAKAVVIELAATDLALAGTRQLASGLPITGTLKAVQSAVVKARVPGELRDLTVREGDSVRAGQLIARVEATEYEQRLRQAQQQADAAKAQMDIAQRQYDNNVALVDKGFISRTALDNSLASLDTARANHRAALSGAEVLRKSLADTQLLAPISGQVSQRFAQPGERVAPEARIVEIVDLSRLEIETAISPADSVGVRLGQTAQLSIEGVSAPVQAEVARINPSAQAGSRSVLVYLTIATQPGLRQGLFAQGELRTGEQQALAVPLAAVRTDRPLPYLQVVEGERIVYRTVEMGARGAVDGELWVAVRGVGEGARVLRAAAGSLREGTQVRLVAGPAANAGSATPARP